MRQRNQSRSSGSSDTLATLSPALSKHPFAVVLRDAPIRFSGDANEGSSTFIRGAATVLFLVLFCCSLTFAADQTITGRILEAAGKPVAGATVMIYHAGPTTGYSTFCPSCYSDCGKRVITAKDGTFSFHHLSADLWFELLAVKVGYEPKFIERVIPDSGGLVSAMLKARHKATDPQRIFRGRILDSNGLAQRDAVVQPVGQLWDTPTGTHSTYYPGNAAPFLDPVAVSGSNGEFEIDASPGNGGWPDGLSGPPLKLLVSVEARGMASLFSVIPAGLKPQTITVRDGALVRGRLVQNGRPVAGAELGLLGNPRGSWGDKFVINGSPYDEIRIGTRPDGTFEIANVPVPGNWMIYTKMVSVAGRGASGIIPWATKRDDEIVDLGDVQLKPAYHFRGKVVLSDGSPVAEGMRVTINSETSNDSQTVTLPPSGDFQFDGLAADKYSVFASVKGYSPPSMPPISVKAANGRVYTYTPPPPPISIEHDIENFVLTLHPNGKVPGNAGRGE